MNVIEIDNLAVEFAGADGVTRAVNGVSMTVPHGKTVALVGESGSGKTVISQAIMGLLPSSARIVSGEIRFRDPQVPDTVTDIAQLDAESVAMRAIRGDRISIIFQEPMTSLSPLHTIGDQLGEVVKLHRGMSQREADKVTTEMLRLVQFPNPERALKTYPFELSGGLRQRAMIAMALMCRPALLIADEPTTALDVTIQAEILRLINDVQHELDMSVLLITHDFGVVANMADEVVVIYHGEIMEAGDSTSIFTSPQHAYLKALLAAVPRFDMPEDERLRPIRPIAAEAGDMLLAARQENPSPPRGETLLELSDVSKIYTLRKFGLGGASRTIKAMDSVDLTVRTGECLGLVGESGSGKTTAAKVVMRAEFPETGSVRYRYNSQLRDVMNLTGEDLMAFRRDVQLVFQDPFSSLNPRMTVYETLLEPFVIHNIGSRDYRAERIRELMTLVGLDQRFLRRYPHSFSGGQRQRIGIARSLALAPDFLLCDEPVSALDVSVQAQILNLLKDLKSELNMTYLFISHNLAVVDYIADRIAVMCKGRIVELGPKGAVIGNPQHPYTRALLAAIPEPSLDRLLDFEEISTGRASVPEDWPEPYRLTDDLHPRLVEIDPEHFVCIPEPMTNVLGEAV